MGSKSQITLDFFEGLEICDGGPSNVLTVLVYILFVGVLSQCGMHNFMTFQVLQSSR